MVGYGFILCDFYQANDKDLGQSKVENKYRLTITCLLSCIASLDGLGVGLPLIFKSSCIHVHYKNEI